MTSWTPGTFTAASRPGSPELSSQFSSGSADPGTDSGAGSSTDSDNPAKRDGGSTGSGD